MEQELNEMGMQALLLTATRSVCVSSIVVADRSITLTLRFAMGSYGDQCV